MNKISISARKEMLENLKSRYKELSWFDKRKVIDGLCSATGYERKYAISILNGNMKKKKTVKAARKIIYDTEVQLTLRTIWLALNQICSKRIVPFLPEIIDVMERNNHLKISLETKAKLLKISSSTVDRLLQSEKTEKRKSISTTRSGNLLKKQIQVRTFSDWNETKPGFLEIDLVCHCGESVSGTFLNTLVLTDISSGWTEFIPLTKKSSADVLQGIESVKKVLPMNILGLDSDNGTEFLNHDMLNYCESNQITFTRSRAYRKNDQAHVEEKNGSIIRRIIGYDRYEGELAKIKLTELYSVLRLYVNYFQPSLKLKSKMRDGSQVSKRYDPAKTPAQRLLINSELSHELKNGIESQYKILDPVALLQKIESLQSEFWSLAWKAEDITVNADIFEELTQPSYGESSKFYRSTRKPRKKVEHTWKTRVDHFEGDWASIELMLKLNPNRTAKEILEELIVNDPVKYSIKYLRTFQRRVKKWREDQIDQQIQRDVIFEIKEMPLVDFPIFVQKKELVVA